MNLFVPEPDPVDADVLAAYRSAISAEVDDLGADLGPDVLTDDDAWDAKIDLLVREPASWVSFTLASRTRVQSTVCGPPVPGF